MSARNRELMGLLPASLLITAGFAGVFIQGKSELTNGSLTYGEYRRVDNGLDRIQAQRARDLRRNDGHLTAGERAQLNREENRLSDRIYFDKHNRARQHR